MKPNLVKLYTIHGAMWIDTRQIIAGRNILTIYTARGNRAADTARTERDREMVRYGVHRENLYASRALADAAFERIHADMARRSQEART